ncbi:serine-rich adhesin for platelets-like [Branchiostoma floridae]|uniref:Serine-rich adhesin for platelets-like n=1 Tax=Branchiostoma floridae TaxID=7739 RepID=A0A9J7HHZ2_BRAFL|nr:serine-rich adhesin for platelets-like [Branchiostoma floridae]
MSATDKAGGVDKADVASASVVTAASFTSSDGDDEGLGTTTYSVSTSSDVESTASSSTVTEVRHKRYVVTSSSGRLSSVPADPGPEPPTFPTTDIVSLNARFMYYVDRVRFLEQENRTLRHSVTELEVRSVSPEMYRTFQQEIDRGRQKVADLGAERAHLQVEVQRLEREMREFNHKVFEESRSRKEALRELEKLKTELYDTKKAYKDAQENLRLRAQEQDFKTRTHEQEVKEVRKEILNISVELEKLRNENTKVAIGVLGAQGELQQYVTGNEGNAQLQSEVHQVSHNASTEVTQYVSMLEKREVELETLHRSLEQQREEYEKLMHMKLDLELALKHHGLEYTTIQYDVHDWSPSHRKSSTPKGTPIRRRPLHEINHSNKKRKAEHPSPADGSFLTDEAAYVSAEGFATESGSQSGYIITESYTIDGSASQQRTQRDETNGTAGGVGDGQLVIGEARAVDAPGLSGPRRVMTASGEYVVASATSTVRCSGEEGDTAMGLTSEGQMATTRATADDRPGLSGPKRILTASGEYVIATSSEEQTTTTTATAEDRPGLSGPKRILTASGDYVIATSSEEQTTTTTATAEDRPGLSGPKRILTASGEYVIATSSEDQTTTTTVQSEDRPCPSGPKRILTASGENVVVTSSEDQTKTTTVKAEDRSSLSGPRHALTSTREYVVMTSSSDEQTTTTTATPEDRPGLSGPKRILTASGEYVIATSSEEQTTTTARTEDRPGLSGPKRVLTPSGEYVVTYSEDQTTTTVQVEDHPGLSGPKRVLTASGEYVVVTSSEHRTASTTKDGVSTEQVKRGSNARDGGIGSYLGTDVVDATKSTSGGYVVESSTKEGVYEGHGKAQKYSADVMETTTTKRRSKGGIGHSEGPPISYSLHQETQTRKTLEKADFEEGSVPSREIVQDRTADSLSFSGDTHMMSVRMWGKFPTKRRQMNTSDKIVSATSSMESSETQTSSTITRIPESSVSVSTSDSTSSGPTTSPSGPGLSPSGSNASLQTLTESDNTLLNSQMAVHFWGRRANRKSLPSGTPTLSELKADRFGGPFAGDRFTSDPITTITSTSTSTERTRTSDGGATHPVTATSTFSTTNRAEVQDMSEASAEKSGWGRFFGRQSRVIRSIQHRTPSHHASGFRQLESNFWGKSVRRENTRTNPASATDLIGRSWWSRLLGVPSVAAVSSVDSIQGVDQDDMDASSAKSGWWRFLTRQSTTSTTRHSSQAIQRELTSTGSSGMTQLGSNSWGKSTRRENTGMRGVDETDTTAVSATHTTVTTTGSDGASGSKKTRRTGARQLVDGSDKTSRTCLSRIGRLCVWLLPLLFLLLLLFFLLSSLFPGGMLGMLLGWERGSCHLQNSFRQSWRFMLRHRSPPPI